MIECLFLCLLKIRCEIGPISGVERKLSYSMGKVSDPKELEMSQVKLEGTSKQVTAGCRFDA